MKSIFCVLWLLSSVSMAAQYEVDLSKIPSEVEATSLVNEVLKENKVIKKEYFCIAGDLTCRTHYSLVDKNGKALDFFFVKFVAVDRSTGSQGYFFPIKGQPGQFIRFEDYSFDGKLVIDKVESENVVTVEKNGDNTVARINGMIIPVLGTSKYVAGDLIVDENAATIRGTRYDKQDPKLAEPVSVVYRRTSLY